MFFVSVTEVAEGKYPEDRNFRVGGLVKDGSVQREPKGSLEMTFTVTDLRCDLTVSYSGVLPDLFREGPGCRGARPPGCKAAVFVADEILAKHDENYMAPEVADSLMPKPRSGRTTSETNRGAVAEKARRRCPSNDS